MKAHVFNSKQAADEAMEYLNQIHGLPTEGGTTKFGERSYDYHPDGFYYKAFNEEWTTELGEPTEITLPTNNNE